LEFGFRYDRGLKLTGAVFHNRIDNIIQSIRTPEGWRVPINLDQARINGFEVGLQHSFGLLKLAANYTFLDTEDRVSGRPLPFVPKSQLNFILDYVPARCWEIAFWGIGATQSETEYRDQIITAPGYLIANAGVSRMLGHFELFLNVENLLDKAYATEPGFPMRKRTFRVGLKLKIGSG
jgi:outer membrane receptor protein involved in Fe transport